MRRCPTAGNLKHLGEVIIYCKISGSRWVQVSLCGLGIGSCEEVTQFVRFTTHYPAKEEQDEEDVGFLFFVCLALARIWWKSSMWCKSVTSSSHAEWLHFSPTPLIHLVSVQRCGPSPLPGGKLWGLVSDHLVRKDLFILREFLSSAAGGLRPLDCHVHWACGECLDHQQSRTILVRGQDYRRLRCCVSEIADEARKLRKPLNFYHVYMEAASEWDEDSK